MSKITSTLGLILIAGMIAVGCDSVVDGDLATQESLIQSEITVDFSAMHGAAITSPTAYEVVYKNSLVLTANDPNIENATANDVHWALVSETNADSRPCTGDIKFNRVNHPYTFSEDGFFEASVDLQGLEAGEYCFVFNTELENPGVGERVVQYFYIVDEYAKIGGNIDNEDYLINKHGSLDLKQLRGRQLSHAFSGVVGNAGSAGTVGSITVNYRQLDEYVEYEADGLTLRAAAGIGVLDPTAVGNVLKVGATEILLLDKDASPNFLRGAVIVRFTGSPSMSKYEIDNTPGAVGANSWIGLENGNVEVGIR